MHNVLVLQVSFMSRASVCKSYLTGYSLDYTAGAWPQPRKYTLASDLFTYTWVFPSIRVVLSVTFILSLVMYMD